MQVGGHSPEMEANQNTANLDSNVHLDGQDEINTFLETITNLEAFDLKLKEDQHYSSSKGGFMYLRNVQQTSKMAQTQNKSLHLTN